MSGICGILSFDGGEPELAPILTLLERRGPDGTRVWRDVPVALGHTLLATTPEALVEVLPLTDQGSGCTITADVRLDNREELIAALRLDSETRTIGDGELILKAYLEWCEDCPKHLLGDFAFAIWDPRLQRLFCARDHMGMRQFNYCHVPGKLFAFATIDTALLAVEAVPKGLNEARLADYIADLEGFDFTSTFFEDIHRLAPAHSLTLDCDGLVVRRYWMLCPPARLDLPDDEAYSAAFLAVFKEAVRCRLRTPNGVGAMLSGGLDSSSIVAVAADILSQEASASLRTLSAVDTQAPCCPETAMIERMLQFSRCNPIRVDPNDMADKRDALISEMEEARNPFEIHGTMLRSLYMTARQNGLNIVLDGGAGDVVLTSGNRIAAHLSRGRFRRAWQQASKARKFWGIGQPLPYLGRELLSGAWVAFVPIAIRSRWRAFRVPRRVRAIAPNFARRIKFAGRQLSADKHVDMTVRGESAKRAQSIAHPNLASGRERYDQLAGSFGIESRDPFMDLRVINFCLSLPPDQLMADGWPKIIVRRAIEPMIGREIAWRKGKEHLGAKFSMTLIQSWPEWSDSMRDPASPLDAYVSKDTLLGLRSNRANAPGDLSMRLFALDRFLRRFNDNYLVGGRPF